MHLNAPPDYDDDDDDACGCGGPCKSLNSNYVYCWLEEEEDKWSQPSRPGRMLLFGDPAIRWQATIEADGRTRDGKAWGI